MSSSTSANLNENNKDSPYEVQKDDVLHSCTTSYLVLDFSGEGSFGKVAKCLNRTTGNEVAVKIHKDGEDVAQVIQEEIDMLRAIGSLDPEKNHIVNFIEDFTFNKLSCLAFEMLDRSLWDLMEERDFTPFSLNEIRPITQQLMVAFSGLKSIGILHTDLKPDNVMLVNHKEQPFKIKLIDFGLAQHVKEVRIGTMMQPLSFRAPEVTLGLPLTEAVDMWGVGCVMAFLYFGMSLFPSECSYNLIRTIVRLLGQPSHSLLSAGLYARHYFSQDGDSHRWRLKLPDEFEEATGIQTKLELTVVDFVGDLEDAVQKYPDRKNDIEYDDRMAFLSLLKATLDVDPDRRVTPSDSLKYSFLSMVHLENKRDTCSYTGEALQCMTVLALNRLDSEPESDDSGDSLPSTPVFCGGDPPQVDREELRVAGITDEETFLDELQEEKNKNKLLQEELERLSVSYQLLIAKYEEDVPKVREQADALQRDLDHEILQKNHLRSDFDKVAGALQEEREINKVLQNRLDQTTVSLNEVSDMRYQTDIMDVRQQADTLRSDLERVLEQKGLIQTAYEDLQEAHRLSQEIFSAQLDAEREKFMVLKEELDKIRTSHYEIAKEKIFVGELDELKTQLSVPSCASLNLKLSTELKAEREAAQKITGRDDDDDCEDEPRKQQEPPIEAEVPKETPCEQQETISPAPALESQQGAEGNVPQRTAEQPSVWKRVRHFLGLRKPKRWKRRRREEEGGEEEEEEG